MVEDIVRTYGFLTLGTRFRRIGERLQADAQQIIAAHGDPVQAAQYPFLAAIERLGPVTVGELAEAVGVTQPGATRALAQLVESGLVQARTASDDQRRRIVSLTAEGSSLVNAARRDVWPRIEAAVADLCGGLSGPLLDQLAVIEDGLSEKPLVRRVDTKRKRRG